MARQGKESGLLPEIPPEDERQTLYVKSIRKTAVKELKKAAIDAGCGVGEIIERMQAAYARIES